MGTNNTDCCTMLQLPISAAILVDNMYLQHASDVFKVGRLDPQKFPEVFLRTPPEKHFMTYIFDALPYVPRYGATQEQKDRRDNKETYFEALEYTERITVELGDVRPKRTICYKCKGEFYVPVQKLVDVKMSVRLVTLAWSEIAKKIVLITGDKDLLPAVQAVEPTGTIVRLAYVEEQNVQTSKALIRECPEKHKISKADLLRCKFKGKKP